MINLDDDDDAGRDKGWFAEGAEWAVICVLALLALFALSAYLDTTDYPPAPEQPATPAELALQRAYDEGRSQGHAEMIDSARAAWQAASAEAASCAARKAP